MTAQEFQDALAELLQNANGEGFSDIINPEWIQTYPDLGVMTQNAGLVIKMDTGDEFQVTIVKSRYSSTDETEE
jgi:hypothetical protein